MGKFYDISNRMDNTKSTVKIDADHEFKINTHKAVGLEINSLYKDESLDSFEKLDKTIKVALGEKAFEYIESLELNMSSYEAIVNVIMAALNGSELEEIEKVAEEEKNKKK
ncbi:MAG: hypothetical protein ABF633_02845 [Clostridium sp.]|uniref:hypothetical protein n=1 Tax=Clostridium sp. TaxID=1506 RepID=UPI0039E733A6